MQTLRVVDDWLENVTLEYIIIRHASRFIDRVDDIVIEDRFEDLKTARKYLKGLLELLKQRDSEENAWKKIGLDEAIGKYIYSFGLNPLDYCTKVENKIIKRTTSIRELDLKGIKTNG